MAISNSYVSLPEGNPILAKLHQNLMPPQFPKKIRRGMPRGSKKFNENSWQTGIIAGGGAQLT